MPSLTSTAATDVGALCRRRAYVAINSISLSPLNLNLNLSGDSSSASSPTPPPPLICPVVDSSSATPSPRHRLLLRRSSALSSTPPPPLLRPVANLSARYMLNLVKDEFVSDLSWNLVFVGLMLFNLAAKGAYGICILTEWDEFKSLDYKKIYESMQKPAFIFDGRNVVDVEKMRGIGFIVYSIGKPIDAWLKDMPADA
ncbi:uncharacterized protein A4U43_C04F2760 [Asparagus officinalis]|uniref:UDP-glucose/GDP-mannose dehydrogenase C-terminal domain-containing protein n=1 Tax=Asparagus officinalis TaxID=4686 RepID=A0A5P1EXR1_ASPOF|nr:uncharacterized protein A4U43_C04F2760 [Asparagus officinalis]